jgi:hypothetical protein
MKHGLNTDFKTTKTLKIKTLIIIAASLVVGALAGFLWASHAFKKFEVAKEVDAAAIASMNSITLAQLRLNETTNAIADLENRMDMCLETLAMWDQVAPPSVEIRKRRDNWLTSVKIYHQSFPVTNKDANLVALVNPFLEKIPGRNPTSTCKGAVCRLDDLRLAALKTEHNSAPK